MQTLQNRNPRDPPVDKNTPQHLSFHQCARSLKKKKTQLFVGFTYLCGEPVFIGYGLCVLCTLNKKFTMETNYHTKTE